MMLTMAWILAGWLAGWLLLRGFRDAGGKLAQSSSDEASDRRGLPAGSVSILIPARDEAANLAQLLPSLSRQSLRPLQIIVIDDGSTDGTAAVAQEFGAFVVQPGELPPGWRGKSWACWKGAEAAEGRWLLFLDADAQLAPDGLSNLLLEGRRAGEGIVSVQPYHTTRKPYENLSAFFNLIVLASVGNGGGSRQGAFGPCLFCSRSTYEEIGGHAAVAGEVLEHHVLGRRAAAQGMPVLTLTGRGTVSFRMYPDGLRSLIQGWTKSFASGAAQTSWVRLLLVSLWLAGAVSAALLPMKAASLSAGSDLAAGKLAVCIAAYAAYAWQLRVLLKRAGSFSLMASLIFPLPLAAFLGIFAYSTLQTYVTRKVTWRGRVLELDAAAPMQAGTPPSKSAAEAIPKRSGNR